MEGSNESVYQETVWYHPDGPVYFDVFGRCYFYLKGAPNVAITPLGDGKYEAGMDGYTLGHITQIENTFEFTTSDDKRGELHHDDFLSAANYFAETYFS